MKRFALSFGIALCFLPLLAQAQAVPVYQLMRDIGNKELLMNDKGGTLVEASVKRFVTGVYFDKNITPDNVDQAWANNLDAFCQTKTGGQTNPIDLKTCRDEQTNIRAIVKREEQVRTLGRDLQIIASGYEQPVNGMGSNQTNLPLRAQSIIRIWKAGTGSVKVTGSGVLVRSLTFPPAATSAMQTLVTELQKLRDKRTMFGPDSDELTAAVWRYQYGWQFVAGKWPGFAPPSEPTADGTERQYLFKHWDAIEQALRDVLASTPLPSDPSLRLSKNEVAIYGISDDPNDPLMELKNQLSALNVSVWAYRQGAASGPTGDAGLQWITPIEPVQPSLCKDGDAETCDPILGGKYSPVPQDGNGLCLLPLSRSGYLCKPLTAKQDAAACNEKVPRDPKNILLTACSGTGVTVVTTSGPDVCQDVNWTQAMPPNVNTQCQINISCNSTAPAPAHAFGLTKAVTGTPGAQVGVITVPVSAKSDIPDEYKLQKQLTNAKEICDLPPGRDPILTNPDGSARDSAGQNQACCTLEGDAYRTACEAMQADGMFGDEKSLETFTVLGVPFNSVSCGELLTDYSCRTKGFGKCTTSFSFTRPLDGSNGSVTALRQELLNVVNSQYKRLHQDDPAIHTTYGSCKALLTPDAKGNLPNARLTATLDSFKSIGRNVCDMPTQYTNTIGNNACYLGQCLEQSMENHRLTPGRQALTSGDEAYPWDACIVPPKSPGNLLTVSPDAPTEFPPYNPLSLVEQMDNALCQLNGMPGELPTIACSFDPRRRLLLPLDIAHTSLDAAQQDIQLQTAQNQISQMSEAIGSRIGTTLYARYLQRSSQTLSDITTNAAILLEGFAKVTFTRVMCPFNDANGSNLRNTPFCQPPPSLGAPRS